MKDTWLVAAAAELRYPHNAHPVDLCDGVRRSELFTQLERVHCAGHAGVDSWAGKLSAKRAVACLLGLDAADPYVLGRIEILPQPRLICSNPVHCERGHPPRARLSPELVPQLPMTVGREATAIEVSIAHDRGVALAAALAIIGGRRTVGY